MSDDDARAARVERVTALALDPDRVRHFTEAHEGLDRAGLITAGHLHAGAPAKGTAAVAPEHRTDSGERLLEHAKDGLSAPVA